MTLEELTAAFNAHKAEAGAKITSLEALLAEKETSIGKLRDKVGEVIREKKKLKAKLTKPAEDDDEEDDEEEADDTPRSRRIAAEQGSRLAQLEAELERVREKAAKADRQELDAKLSDLLSKAKVGPAYLAAARALLSTSRKVELADGAVLLDGKPAADVVSAWVASDEGRAFVAQPASGGSAPIGAPASGTSVVTSRAKMTAAERGAYIRQHGPEAYAKLPK